MAEISIVDAPSEPREPGSSIRVAVVADDGRRSTTWRIWGSKNHDDVYVAGRESAEVVKVSLHESGRWQHGFTTEAVRQGAARPGENRHFHRWDKPEPIAPGITLGLRVLLANSELRSGEVGRQSKEVIVAPPAEHGSGIAIDIYLVDKDCPLEHVEFPRAALVGRLKLPAGGEVLVMAQDVTLDDEPARLFADIVDRAASIASKHDIEDGVVPRIVVYGHNQEHATLELVELAVDVK